MALFYQGTLKAVVMATERKNIFWNGLRINSLNTCPITYIKTKQFSQHRLNTFRWWYTWNGSYILHRIKTTFVGYFRVHTHRTDCNTVFRTQSEYIIRFSVPGKTKALLVSFLWKKIHFFIQNNHKGKIYVSIILLIYS